MTLINSLITKYENENINIILVFNGKPSITIRKEILNNNKIIKCYYLDNERAKDLIAF